MNDQTAVISFVRNERVRAGSVHEPSEKRGDKLGELIGDRSREHKSRFGSSGRMQIRFCSLPLGVEEAARTRAALAHAA